jgi:hypothetical protein
MNTTLIENRTILDGSDLDDFDKVNCTYLFLNVILCAVCNPYQSIDFMNFFTI